MVKYFEHCVSYVVFLLLYTYFLLFDFEWRIQHTEIVVYVWLATLVVDECRELILQPATKLARKFHDYLNSVWNKFDLAIFTLAFAR